MALELWIFLALAAAAIVAAVVTRWRRKRAPQTGQSERNVYPLW